MLNEWYNLVVSTGSRLKLDLPEDSEWYVVNMLATRTELEEWPTIAYAQLVTSNNIICDLRRLGDSGLIMPSMFPKRCEKLDICPKWYYTISRMCYLQLYQRLSEMTYKSVLDNFHTIVVILSEIGKKR